MAYLFGWLVTSTLALFALPVAKAAVFGLIILIVTQIGMGVVMLPFGLFLGLFERDMNKRKQVVDKSFMPLQFVTFLIVVYLAYRYSPLLPISVVGGYSHWYFSYRHQERRYKDFITEAKQDK